MRVRERYKLIEKRMAGIEPIPADFPQYVEENIQHHLFYSRKEGSCYCTHCKSEVPYQPLHHKEAAVCPKCGKQTTARSKGMSRLSDDINWFTLVQHFEDGLVVRHFRTLVNWEDFTAPVIKTEELYRNVITPKSFKEYMWWWKYQENELAWIPYKKRGFSWYAYEGNLWHPYTAKCYTDLDEVIKGTNFQYSCLTGLLHDFNLLGDDGIISLYGIEKTLNTYRDMPYLEMLYKVGFHNLIRGVSEPGVGKMFHDAKDIYGVLGVDKAQYKMLLAKVNPTVTEYKAMLLVNAHEQEDWEFGIGALNDRNGYNVESISRIVPIHKAIRYIRKTGITVDEYCRHLMGCIQLGHNTADEYYAFPNDRVRALVRNEIAEQRRIRNEAENLKKMIDNADTLNLIREIRAGTDGNEAYHMHYNGMFIRIARDTEELIREGEILHHCVGRIYAPKMEVGETMIFLIRRESDPETPFFTMEWKDGKVKQLYGNHDCLPTEEVVAFKAEFLRRVKEIKMPVAA